MLEAQPKPAAPPQPDLTGRMLGEFHILRRLGTGGMGQVYLARQLSLKREVALKLLRGDLIANHTALARFQAEAQAVAKLNHPNIVHIHQIGDSDGLRYMVLEYVDGRNLREYLARKGPPDLLISLSIIRQVVLALQKAHEQGIVHRDIKPENILVTRKVEVKVTDFGLSRFFTSEALPTNLTQSGVTVGTPLYMSPEQVQGHTLDYRSDIYSLGVTCYHLLAGEPPFRGASAFEVALKHVQEKPRQLRDIRPDLPADLCGMSHKMMAKNPRDRYQTTREILRELTTIRDSLNGSVGQLELSQFAERSPGGSLPGDELLSLSESGAVAKIPTKRGQWFRIAALCLLALLGGVVLNLALRAGPEAQQHTNEPETAAVGLPDIRPPEQLTTTRERELLAILNTEGTKPDQVIKASIELGLLYVKEGRLADANERFERLRGKVSEWRDFQAARSASVTGRLGLAVVLAHENKPEASNKLFLDVANESLPQPKFGPGIGPGVGGPGKGGDRSIFNVSWTLLRYPDLSHAVSDALNRNAANLGKSRLEPAVLEQLRSPQRFGRKE